ncbi:Uncharacterised protein [Mycobacteroides abscessus subsp. abscessus]|nr:Uncharacterised protein [Mycobacteroides abscessus subsp. abscessus]
MPDPVIQICKPFGKLLFLPDQYFVILDDLVKKFVYFIFVIASEAFAELLVMYI